MMFGSKPGVESELEGLKAEVSKLSGAVAQMQRLLAPMGIPYPDGSMLVQSLHGIKYLIDPQDLVIAPELMVQRQWEPDLTQLVAAAVGRDTTFVDVGASFGYFTCLAASTIGNAGQGKVIAIEPNPAMLDLLRKNILINWSICPVTVHGLAVSDHVGLAEFSIPVGRAANAMLAIGGRGSAGQASDDRITVRLKRLDDIVPDGTRVDLMKIDVEGQERAVLAGAARVIAQSPDVRIIMEWSLGQLNAAGSSVDDMVAEFDSRGLVPCRIPADRILAHAEQNVLTRDALAATTYDNIILVRR
jgi:FkbM family methyltransferase